MNQNNRRWEQRFASYRKALRCLENAVELHAQRALSPLEKQGLIKSFEFTHELAWNVLKDFLKDQGAQDITGSKDTTRHAFKRGIIRDGSLWMGMIQSRKLSSHTYNEQTADEVVELVTRQYLAQFLALESGWERRLT